MFTGLIAGQGEVVFFNKTGEQARVGLRPLFFWDKPELGESVSVNGVCLTVEIWEQGVFLAYISGGTLAASTMGKLTAGQKVNLERALAVGDRVGGHLVSGHVDTVATVLSAVNLGESTRFRLGFAEEWSRQIISKGSIALDGVSLTINEHGPGFLEVNVIPATSKITTIQKWKTGSQVNMETDMIGKYVAQLISGSKIGASSGLTMDFLREHGF